jgi:glutamyl-tRNA reductase
MDAVNGGPLMHRLMMLGLSHATADLATREKFAFDAQQQRQVLEQFKEKFPGSEAALLCTCNRIELYVSGSAIDDPGFTHLTDFLCNARGVQADEFARHWYHRSERAVVHHLFTVVSSLDSMVLGENQILGQVREAYDMAHELNATGSMLNPLFQRALAVGKQVMSDTALGAGRLSIASVAIDYAKRIFDHFDDKTVLNIGAGEMAELVLQHLTDLKPGQLFLCNRTVDRAEELSKRFGGRVASLNDLDDLLVTADIVVTSTGAPKPIITRNQFEKLLRRRRYRPIFIIDIAMPRDVEASIEQLDNVYLYNLDHLQQVVSQTQSQRKDAIAAAQQIVLQQVDAFVSWHRRRELGPLIDALYQKYHRAAQEEIQRTLNKLPNITEAEKEHLQELARRIVNKLLHDPMRMLKNADNAHGPPVQYLHAMEKLFGLAENAEPPTPLNPPNEELP